MTAEQLDALERAAMKRLRAFITRLTNGHLRAMGLKS
jgi:hypothetical protein